MSDMSKRKAKKQRKGVEIKVVNRDGQVRLDGELLSWDPSGIKLKGSQEVIPVSEDELVVTQVPQEQWSEGDRLLIVAPLGCAGLYLYCGALGMRLRDGTFCFKPDGEDTFVPTRFEPEKVYKILPAPAPEPEAEATQSKGPEIKVVTQDGGIRIDGELISWDSKGLRLKGEETTFSVEPGELVVTQVPADHWAEGDQLLVVNRWGCGGAGMTCGAFGGRLMTGDFCFKPDGSDLFVPTPLEPEKVYKILTAPSPEATTK